MGACWPEEEGTTEEEASAISLAWIGEPLGDRKESIRELSTKSLYQTQAPSTLYQNQFSTTGALIEPRLELRAAPDEAHACNR